MKKITNTSRAQQQKEELTRKDILEKNQKKLKALSNTIHNQQLIDVFEPVAVVDKYKCMICPTKQRKISYKNLKRHLLTCETHKLSLRTSKDRKIHESLVKCINQRQKLKIDEESRSKMQSGFIKFIVSCSKAKCSFNQILAIGNTLKEMYLKDGLYFLKDCNFSLEMISKAINCFGKALLEDLVGDLAQNEFSIAIDTTTKGGKNICALEAKYLKERYNVSENMKEFSIQNRVIGIKYLGETATGDEMFNILTKFESTIQSKFSKYRS